LRARSVLTHGFLFWPGIPMVTGRDVPR
jgi:hypothetical protein